MSIYGYDVREGREVLDHHLTARRNRAAALRRERSRVREIFSKHEDLLKDIRLRNNVVQDNVNREHGPARYTPFKPTVENFRTAATNRYDYGNSRWSNPYDTEYYSACGYDDYQGELRNAAVAEAVEYFRAWKVLTGK